MSNKAERRVFLALCVLVTLGALFCAVLMFANGQWGYGIVELLLGIAAGGVTYEIGRAT